MLKTRIGAGERLVGTFLKTAHHSVVEVLGRSGLDFIILDTEHSPFSIAEMDRCILAGRASGIPVLVRLVEGSAASILQVLDMGADGIVVPQVKTAAEAQEIVRKTQYGRNGRGFAGTTRAGGFGTVPALDLVANARNTVVILQIEESEGVANVAAIAATPGVDACFVGRADIAASFEVFDSNHAEVVAATQTVLDACRTCQTPVVIFASDLAQAPAWFEKGASIIAVGSEHQAMLSYFGADNISDAKSG